MGFWCTKAWVDWLLFNVTLWLTSFWNFLPFRSTRVISRGVYVVQCFLCSVLSTISCPFVIFLLVLIMFVLRLSASDFHFAICTLFLITMQISIQVKHFYSYPFYFLVIYSPNNVVLLWPLKEIAINFLVLVKSTSFKG